jgi:hypothetical protein
MQKADLRKKVTIGNPKKNAECGVKILSKKSAQGAGLEPLRLEERPLALRQRESKEQRA